MLYFAIQNIWTCICIILLHLKCIIGHRYKHHSKLSLTILNGVCLCDFHHFSETSSVKSTNPIDYSGIYSTEGMLGNHWLLQSKASINDNTCPQRMVAFINIMQPRQQKWRLIVREFATQQFWLNRGCFHTGNDYKDVRHYHSFWW